MGVIIWLAIIAALATAADAIWYTFGVRHTMVAGLAHGAVLLTAVGAALGSASGQAIKGLPIGTLAGLGGALAYYLLIATVDDRTYGSAIPLAWIIMWLMLATLDGRWIRHQPRPWKSVVIRGFIAAVLGGLAFYLVVDTLWGRPGVSGRNYVVQFLAWAFAWAPGLVALTAGGGSSAAGSAESLTAAALLARIERGERPAILDVRSAGEFAAGHIPGAVNIPFTQLGSRMSEVPGTMADELIVYCGHGPRAWLAATTLRSHGRTHIVHPSGHWAAWQQAGFRVERQTKG